MDNSYFTQVAPYFQQQDQNLNPVFQNIGGQQANENAALQQQMQNNQAAGQAYQQGGMGGLSPLAMAAALRKTTPFGSSGMSEGMINNGVTGNIYDNYGNLLSTGNAAPSAATWNQAFGGTGGMSD